MTSPRTTRFPVPRLVALLGVAIFVAACGSSGTSSSPASASSATTSAAAASSATTSSSASSMPTAAVTVSTAKGSHGTYLVGSSGRALYIWMADTSGKSNCSGACASAWPPLITKGTPAASGGVNSADLSTITRANGSKQVTYNGHPLYYYVGDTGSGTTKGQGSDGFGAKWWLVAPSGAAITAKKSSSGSSSSSGWG